MGALGRVLAAALLAVGAAGCGSGGGGHPTSTPSPRGSATAPPLSSVYFVLGAADGGKTFDLTPGRVIGVSLTGSWTIASSQPAVLKPEGSAAPVAGGTVAEFQAAGLGQANITASPKGSGAGWQVTVLVVKSLP